MTQKAQQVEIVPDTSELRALLDTLLASRLEAVNMKPSDISTETDLFTAGILDSFDVVEILSELEERTGQEADMNEDSGSSFVVSIDWFIARFVIA